MRAVVPLPYDSPPLSLNDRGMTRKAMYAKAAKIADTRADITRLARRAHLPKAAGHAAIELHWRPSTNRRRDTDNLAPTLKALCDGLVDYGLVPDDIPQHMAKLEPVIHRHAPKTTEPRMWLVITTTPESKELPA